MQVWNFNVSLQSHLAAELTNISQSILKVILMTLWTSAKLNRVVSAGFPLMENELIMQKLKKGRFKSHVFLDAVQNIFAAIPCQLGSNECQICSISFSWLV